MAVDVKSSGSIFEARAPKELFDSAYIKLGHVANYTRSLFQPTFSSDSFTADRERLARFEREARLLAPADEGRG
jgi:hypothetical protein